MTLRYRQINLNDVHFISYFINIKNIGVNYNNLKLFFPFKYLITLNHFLMH